MRRWAAVFASAWRTTLAVAIVLPLSVLAGMAGFWTVRALGMRPGPAVHSQEGRPLAGPPLRLAAGPTDQAKS